MEEHHFSLTEIENLFPYELEIYLMLLKEHQLKKQQQDANL